MTDAERHVESVRGAYSEPKTASLWTLYFLMVGLVLLLLVSFSIMGYMASSLGVKEKEIELVRKSSRLFVEHESLTNTLKQQNTALAQVQEALYEIPWSQYPSAATVLNRVGFKTIRPPQTAPPATAPAN